jgi:hypothetical protein
LVAEDTLDRAANPVGGLTLGGHVLLGLEVGQRVRLPPLKKLAAGSDGTRKIRLPLHATPDGGLMAAKEFAEFFGAEETIAGATFEVGLELS